MGLPQYSRFLIVGQVRIVIREMRVKLSKQITDLNAKPMAYFEVDE